ncbi:hypothetical protein Pfo_010900 [Paulownia fortunei]|nr:hypothetical protein Pfo_010900 [Paulownia fortunei]
MIHHYKQTKRGLDTAVGLLVWKFCVLTLFVEISKEPIRRYLYVSGRVSLSHVYVKCLCKLVFKNGRAIESGSNNHMSLDICRQFEL